MKSGMFILCQTFDNKCLFSTLDEKIDVAGSFFKCEKSEKNMPINFSSQNFSEEHNFSYTNVR